MKGERGRSRVGEQRGRRKEEGREKKNVRPSLQNVGGGVVTVKGRGENCTGEREDVMEVELWRKGETWCDVHEWM